jgi:hypothetical protein
MQTLTIRNSSEGHFSTAHKQAPVAVRSKPSYRL